MHIGDVAARAGLSAKAIRYYESIGLVPAAGRARSGYRDYDEQDVRVLVFVRRARSLGFSVRECRELLALRRDNRRASAEVREIALRHAGDLEDRIVELRHTKDALDALVACCRGDDTPECAILDTLAQVDGDATNPGSSESARELSARYLRAFYAGARAEARACLADDVTFLSPAASFEGAERVLAATAHVAHGARGIETKLVVAEGADVCTLYDLLLLEHAPLTVSEHHHTRAGRIATIRMVVDLSPFVPRRAPAAPEETAIDPVCKMSVERATAAATREHAGQTYYFCQQGCALAFERDPGAYLVSE